MPQSRIPDESELSPSGRLVSVDVLRGLCVAGMVLVNFPADWVLRYHQLSHVEWNGATATDMIFPAFLLLSGFSLVYSFTSRIRRGATRMQLAHHVLTRSLALIILGLVLNAVPTFEWHTLHFFGVLQRIALCYLVGGLLVLGTARRNPVTNQGLQVNTWVVGLSALLILAGVWAAVRFIHVPSYGSWRFDHDGNLGAVFDRAAFGNSHLSDWGGPKRMWDADGVLSCIASVPNLLLGVLVAVWVRGQRKLAATVAGMALGGGLLIAVGLMLNSYLVINRKLWTDSFTLLSGGVSLCSFAVLYPLLDGVTARNNKRRGAWWLKPALVYGSNAILGFVLYSLLLVISKLTRIPGSHSPAFWLPGGAYRTLCAWIDPYNVSLLYGLLAVGVILALLWPLYQWKIFLKL